MDKLRRHTFFFKKIFIFINFPATNPYIKIVQFIQAPKCVNFKD